MNHETAMRARVSSARDAPSRLQQCALPFWSFGWPSPRLEACFRRVGQQLAIHSGAKELFEKRCGGCHSLDKDKEGPRLGNVFGRKAGTIATFKYSDSLKSAQVVWDAALLDREWLINTDAVVPDNDMDFHVPKADERADIIQFLRASSGK